jgi:hypothetical protein
MEMSDEWGDSEEEWRVGTAGEELDGGGEVGERAEVDGDEVSDEEEEGELELGVEGE